MLKLLDLIELSGLKLTSYRIHCATPSSTASDPMAAFLDGSFEQWQSWQSMQNFKGAHILSLIQRHNTKWLFAGVWDVLGHPKQLNQPYFHYEYQTKERTETADLAGRVVVSFRPTGRKRYLIGSTWGSKLLVDHILPTKQSLKDFPGFQSVLLSHSELRRIIREGVQSWRIALQSVGGIYLIYDKSRGGHYVGSAFGADGIWGRWCNYAGSGHGGNVDLIKLLKENGPDHADNFQYSVLEVLNPMTHEKEVTRRETHWKQVLGSRQHGHNRN